MSVKRMIEVVRASGYRITRQRMAILDYLASRIDSHPSARQIHMDLAGTVGGLSVATVYNTLGTLSRLGLVRILEFDGSDNRYESNMAPHINLVCTGCRTIEDLEAPVVVDVEAAGREAGFSVKGTRMEFHGLCRDCMPPLKPH